MKNYRVQTFGSCCGNCKHQSDNLCIADISDELEIMVNDYRKHKNWIKEHTIVLNGICNKIKQSSK